MSAGAFGGSMSEAIVKPFTKAEMEAVRRAARDEDGVRRDFWAKLKRVAAPDPFAEDILAAFYCALDPVDAEPGRSFSLAPSPISSSHRCDHRISCPCSAPPTPRGRPRRGDHAGRRRHHRRAPRAGPPEALEDRAEDTAKA